MWAAHTRTCKSQQVSSKYWGVKLFSREEESRKLEIGITMSGCHLHFIYSRHFILPCGLKNDVSFMQEAEAQ
jgi:hypothetical protein